ncbi:TatD family hydrolase [Clostridia bacterium]|nr:TatD family hydrolase [Clostridia bacterium]
MWIDTHVHLNDDRLYEQAEDVLLRAKKDNVGLVINVSYDLESSRRGVELAQIYENVYTAVGMHPHDAKDYTEAFKEEMYRLAKDNKVVAYGEIGLDYHYDLSPRELQKKVFVDQIHLANELSLPVIIHNRESHGDMLEILKKTPIEGNTVMHCFSGSVEFMKECVKLGLYISFAGPITFKNAHKLLDVVAETPTERLLVETDCPYLTPVPYRGKTNEPKNVTWVAKKVSEIKGIPLEELEVILEQNSRTFFNL